MTYLIIQMFLCMLVTFLLGLLLGWLFWRYRRPTIREIDAMRDENKGLRADLDTCNIKTEQLEVQVKKPFAAAASVVPSPAPIAAAKPEPTTTESTKIDQSSKPKGLSTPRGDNADEHQLILLVGPKREGPLLFWVLSL